MRNAETNIESIVTRKIIQDTEKSIAEIERMLRKPLSPKELSEVLSLYTELTLARAAVKQIAL